MSDATRLGLAPGDHVRLHEVDALEARGPAGAVELVRRLDDPSWPVRRAVVGALARLGDAAVEPLIVALRDRRDHEGRLAAAVDALCASRGSPETALLALAADGAAPAVICDVAQILGRRRSTAASAALAAWTAHADDNVAVCAIEALGRIGGGAGLDAVIAAASSGSFFRVFPAIDVLSRTEDPRALAPLESLLADPLAGAETARALGRRGQLDAVPALAGQLVARTEQLIRIAAVALVDVESLQRARFGTADRVGTSVREALADRSAQAASRLARALPGAAPAERVALSHVLGWLGEDVAAATLLELLDQEPGVAEAAAHALARRAGDLATRDLTAALRDGTSERRARLLPAMPSRGEMAPAILPCLDDDDPGVRALACDALARASATSAIPALFRLLDDDDARVAQAAVGAIQTLGHESTEGLALEGARSPRARVRRAALRMIGYFGWASGLPALLAALADPEPKLRDAAIHSLPFVDDPRALEALLSIAGAPATDDAARGAAMRALGQVAASPAVIACLESGVRHPAAWVRYYACQSLGRIGAVGSLDVLIGRLEDDAGHVRVAVIDALARMPGERATAALVAATDAADPDARRAALIGLGIARPPSALPVLLAAARDGDPATRVIALSALTAWDDPAADAALAEAAGEADAAIHGAAIGALGARAGRAATDALVALLDDAVLRAPAIDALATHAIGRVPALLAAIEIAPAARAASVVSALARMGRDDARAALCVVLAMERPEARRAAAAAFAATGASLARPALERAAAADADPEVRRLAAHALGRR